jgi:hypothetical protein
MYEIKPRPFASTGSNPQKPYTGTQDDIMTQLKSETGV